MKILANLIAVLAIVGVSFVLLNVRHTGAEDDCAMGTWSVVALSDGVACIFE